VSEFAVLSALYTWVPEAIVTLLPSEPSRSSPSSELEPPQLNKTKHNRVVSKKVFIVFIVYSFENVKDKN
jgi:hypothetical protein